MQSSIQPDIQLIRRPIIGHVLHYILKQNISQPTYLGLLYKLIDAHAPVYADADHAGNTETSLSATGVFIALSNFSVLWISKKQRIVAESMAYAEYQALFEAIKLSRYFVAVKNSLGVHPTDHR